ncbi:hypothetical protein PoB_002936500 [Plakobranchus ocellatus]|uniref:Uncharacterized protein n=1 Tax=Plakobranchus ocellatus TaxID=259542 RepID=A0AAV4A410_9GAST|nr:hypothetical protein PoB_002936500 [Plakobranchus ocellatus]
MKAKEVEHTLEEDGLKTQRNGLELVWQGWKTSAQQKRLSRDKERGIVEIHHDGDDHSACDTRLGILDINNNTHYIRILLQRGWC